MSSDDRQSAAPPVVVDAPDETAVTPVPATEALELVDATPPTIVDPEMLVQALRYLQQSIPGFTQLSVQEKRSYARAANLDPEFLESGLHAAAVWLETKVYVKRTGEELRQEDDETRRLDKMLLEMRAFMDGINAINLKKKHRLGRAILQIYRILSISFRFNNPKMAYMRPYYENMKRAYQRTQKFRKGKKKKKGEPASEE